MKISLKTKTFVMIFIMTAVLCAASIIGTNIALTNIIRQQFIDKAESLTNAMADLIDKEAAAKVRDEVMKIYNETDDKDKVSNEECIIPSSMHCTTNSGSKRGKSRRNG